MATDKTTIGVTAKGQQVLERLQERKVFADQMDAAKLALSLAISKGIRPSDTPAVDTKWNVGSFDRDGTVRTVVSVLFPDASEPYRAVESLVNAGLDLMDRELGSGGDIEILKLLPKPTSKA